MGTHLDVRLRKPWHHDVFHADGRPYRQAEIDQLRALTGAAHKSFDKARGKK